MAEPKDPAEMTDEEIRAEYERAQQIDRHMRAEAARQAWDIPSAFSNQFHVNLSTEGLMRVTFGEASVTGGVPVAWRTSVTMTEDQALQLADFIWQQHDQARARRDAAKSAAAEVLAKQGSKNG